MGELRKFNIVLSAVDEVLSQSNLSLYRCVYTSALTKYLLEEYAPDEFDSVELFQGSARWYNDVFVDLYTRTSEGQRIDRTDMRRYKKLGKIIEVEANENAKPNDLVTWYGEKRAIHDIDALYGHVALYLKRKQQTLLCDPTAYNFQRAKCLPIPRIAIAEIDESEINGVSKFSYTPKSKHIKRVFGEYSYENLKMMPVLEQLGEDGDLNPKRHVALFTEICNRIEKAILLGV